jgi:hypothetical protein
MMINIFEIWHGRTLMSWSILFLGEVDLLLAVIIFYQKPSSLYCLFFAFMAGWSFYSWYIDKNNNEMQSLMRRMLEHIRKLTILNARIIDRVRRRYNEI